LERAGAKTGQAYKDQGLSQRLQSEALPGSGLFKAHGVDRHEDLSRDSTQETQKVRAVRWKIEEFHREAKQLTGIEACQCRASRIQRNHIACALVVWSRLKSLANQSGQTIYRIKRSLLHNYLVHQLKNPSVEMVLA
jgi:hypothetical protein